MSISITHKFVSAKGDGTDATLVRPSNWNDTHTITMATGNLLGRQTAGTGAVEEIPLSAYVVTLLNATDYATLAALLNLPTTGDIKPTLKSTADSGWVMCNDGSISNIGQGGTTRANADCQALFTLIWNNVSNTYAPVQDNTGTPVSRGGSAAADWSGNRRIVLTKMLGRALAAAGAGSGLTSRALGETQGAETITIARNQLPNVTLSGTTDNGGVDHTHGTNIFTNTGFGIAVGSGGSQWNNAATTTGGASAYLHTHTFTTSSINGGVSQQTTSVMQPTSFVNFMIKL